MAAWDRARDLGRYVRRERRHAIPGSHSIESSRSRHVTEETLGWQFHLRRSETPTLQSGGVQRNGIKFECGKLSTGGAASDAA
ncbi:hypothetical protein BHE74_00015474 [Ensete ventricosum]|nr:hypothetical protein GW17_00033300 [Ensete ventricosum]RWW76432.1 hypothetical protein BHE74_00015474 [Ensete ventricosum]